MDSRPEPERPDLNLLLPRDVDYQIIHTLRATLPPITDTPADLIRRDNAEEANVAATYAAARAHAMDCLLLAREHAATDHGFALKCGTQTASMLRQARATRTLLLRVQAERRTREADSAARTEHCAIGLMVQAFTDAPTRQPRLRRRPHRPPTSPPRPINTRWPTASAPPSSASWAACRISSIVGRCRSNSSGQLSPAPARSCGRPTRETVSQPEDY